MPIRCSLQGDRHMRFENSPLPAIFVGRSVSVEAIEWTGSMECFDGIAAWAGSNITCNTHIDRDGGISLELITNTLEGPLHVSVGDFIVKGTIGEFYPVKPEVFNNKYVKWDGKPSTMVSTFSDAQLGFVIDALHDKEVLDAINGEFRLRGLDKR